VNRNAEMGGRGKRGGAGPWKGVHCDRQKKGVCVFTQGKGTKEVTKVERKDRRVKVNMP